MSGSKAQPGARIALVVGISKYPQGLELPSAAKDAIALGDALDRLGFEVTHLVDAEKSTLERQLRAFGERATQADLAVVFFAGYGIEVDGKNFLIPADAHLQQIRDLAYDAVPLETFLNSLADTREVGVMIVDDYGGEPYLHQLQGGDPSIRIGSKIDLLGQELDGILVATSSETPAPDRGDGHSPFTEALLQELKSPGVDVRRFFQEVADRVRVATDNQQQTALSGTLNQDQVFLNDGSNHLGAQE